MKAPGLQGFSPDHRGPLALPTPSLLPFGRGVAMPVSILLPSSLLVRTLAGARGRGCYLSSH